MKIHSILIENIASLRGKHYIDFDEITKSSPLFAITGETGAGKSTILNSISLALYGKNYKKNIVHYDLVTLGEKKGKVELIFSVKKEFYKAVFESTIRKTNGEFLKKPKSTREFYHLIDNQEKMLDFPPENVINLNYEQFCKTIILNQGMFAEFLTSDFKERKDILNKLYQSDYLEKLNPKLREKINATVRNKEKLESRLSGIQLNQTQELDQKKIDDLSNKLKNSEANFQSAKDVYEVLKECQKLQVQYNGFQTKKDQIENDLKLTIEKHIETQKELTNKQGNFEKIKNNYDQKLPHLLKALELTKANKVLTEKLNQLNENINKDNEKINKIKLSINESQIKLKELKKSYTEQKTNPSLKNEDIDKYNILLNEIDQNSIKIKFLENTNSELENNIKSLKNEKTSNQHELEKRKESSASIINLLKDFNFEKCEINIKHLYRLNDIKKSVESKNKKLTQEVNDLKNLLEKLHEKQVINTQQLSKKNAIQESLQKLKNKSELENAKMICHAQSQVDGTCVICGSSYNETHSIERNDILALNQQIDANNDDLKQLEIDKNIYSTKIQQLKKDINVKEQDIKQNCNDLIIAINQTQINSLKSSNNFLEKAKKEEVLLKSQNENQNILQENNIHITQTNKELEKIEMGLNKINSKIKTNKSELDVLLKKQKTLTSTLPIELEQFRRDLQILIKSKHLLDAIEKIETSLKHEDKNYQIILENKNQKLLDKAHREEEILRNKEYIKETTTNDPQTEIESLKKEIKSAENELETISKALKNISEDKVNIESRRKMIIDQLKDSTNLFQQNIAKFKDINLQPPWNEFSLNDLTIEHSKVILSALMLKAEHNLTAKQTILDNEKKQYHQLNILYQEQQKREVEINNISKDLKLTNKDLTQWEELYQLIGKDEFRNYILSIVEKNLIQQTNFELDKICDGRYKLKQISKSNNTSEFYVIDHFHGNEIRKVSTLSGGETFMVSLAMSLALSDLTRGQAQIDSFFIDEGFGTLDQDSLEDVYLMLNEINKRGKQIGLISHVKELTKRIAININLRKNRLGDSGVVIISN